MERLLQQFLKTDGPKGATSAYKEGWDRIFGNSASPAMASAPSPGAASASKCDGTGCAVLPASLTAYWRAQALRRQVAPQPSTRGHLRRWARRLPLYCPKWLHRTSQATSEPLLHRASEGWDYALRSLQAGAAPCGPAPALASPSSTAERASDSTTLGTSGPSGSPSSSSTALQSSLEAGCEP